MFDDIMLATLGTWFNHGDPWWPTMNGGQMEMLAPQSYIYTYMEYIYYQKTSYIIWCKETPLVLNLTSSQIMSYIPLQNANLIYYGYLICP